MQHTGCNPVMEPPSPVLQVTKPNVVLQTEAAGQADPDSSSESTQGGCPGMRGEFIEAWGRKGVVKQCRRRRNSKGKKTSAGRGGGKGDSPVKLREKRPKQSTDRLFYWLEQLLGKLTSGTMQRHSYSFASPSRASRGGSILHSWQCLTNLFVGCKSNCWNRQLFQM